VVTVYLKGADDQEHIQEATYEGRGCTISMAASSMILDEVHRGNLTMEQVLEMDYNEMIEQLGRQIVASRPKCATLGLGTLKAAIRKYQKDRRLEEAGVERPDNGGFVFGDHAAEAAARTE
jgi:nitrogen fixation protein NifU and related proteins